MLLLLLGAALTCFHPDEVGGMGNHETESRVFCDLPSS